MSLKVYNRKRKFDETTEPRGKPKKNKGDLRFVVQLHRASRLHFDFRLEFGGVLKSWAVPRGPSLNPLDQRLAVFVEDHPIEYGSFEGIIPKGNYGAGTVMVWDEGTYEERSSSNREESEIAMEKGLQKGHITFVLNGQKLKGEFALIRLKKGADDKPWLLVKKRDEHSTYKRNAEPDPHSVKTGRTLDEIASQSEKKGAIWLSKRKQTLKSGLKATLKPKPSPEKEKPKEKSKRPLHPMPRKVRPMIPTFSREIPKSKNWIFEKDSKGLRAIAEIEGHRVHLYSKTGLPFEKKFPNLVGELKNLKHLAVLDGKITGASSRAIYEVFDILYFDGKDLRELPLKKRKEILDKIHFPNNYLRQSKIINTPVKGAALIAKNLESFYKSGTSAQWLQVSFDPSQTFIPAKKRDGVISQSKNKIILKKTKKMIHPSKAILDEPLLTHLDKVFWPQEKITKGDLLNYYRSISPYILPYLKDRPESLNRQPNGIAAPGFYQKDMTGHIPRWLKTQRIFSESADKSIDYVVCQDERSLLYIVNLGCIEINPWFSRIPKLDKPDFMVIDLDPDENDFTHVIEVAKKVHEILDKVGAANYCKTSGATGIHIGVPMGARYDFDTVRAFAQSICQIVAKEFPSTTSLERNPARRKKKIYLDYMQNRKGQTLAAPYCVRPRAGAPVSMPLKWKDLSSQTRPEDFHIENALRRIEKVGDLWAPVIKDSTNLNDCVRSLKRKFGKR